MKLIINTFKYGSSKTKFILALTLIAGIATLGFAVSAILLRQMLLFFCTLISVFITIYLSQTFIIKNQDGDADYQADSAEEVDSTGIDEKLENIDNIDVSQPESRQSKKKKIKFSIKKKQDKKETEPEAEVKSDENIEEDHKEVVRLTEEEINNYSQRKLKKTLHKYKVRRDHRMAMVDHCDNFRIKQTPAFIWVYGKEFHILLIEKEPRHITIPTFKLREITYFKKQEANEDVDYAAFKGKSMFAEMFKPYLPDYIHSTVIDDLTAYKNLYGIGPDIYFTNRSAANLFDLLAPEFIVDDKVTMSSKVNIYFKDVYKANILLRDNVIDANGYAQKISGILEDMAKSTISYNEFKDTLSLMIRNKLITQEFAVYYMEVRDKSSR